MVCAPLLDCPLTIWQDHKPVNNFLAKSSTLDYPPNMQTTPLHRDLAELADAAGSRADLARLAGVSEAAVSRVLSGDRGILSGTAEALIRALGLRVVLVPDEGEE
jgi:transcriptional regulator with XRE-family HTH domain